MDTLQKQIIDLTHKVEALYQMVENLSSQLQNFLVENQQQKSAEELTGMSATTYSDYQRGNAQSSMEHKDILTDSGVWNSSGEQSYDHNMSPETQIRRLTAQLTAAYNRIAALEEQLLAKRIHS